VALSPHPAKLRTSKPASNVNVIWRMSLPSGPAFQEAVKKTPLAIDVFLG
jgi:hypothetical protein